MHGIRTPLLRVGTGRGSQITWSGKWAPRGVVDKDFGRRDRKGVRMPGKRREWAEDVTNVSRRSELRDLLPSMNRFFSKNKWTDPSTMFQRWHVPWNDTATLPTIYILRYARKARVSQRGVFVNVLRWKSYISGADFAPMLALLNY